ncbi:unnamed protein product, partial [Amoebophrya sp. A120]
HAARKFERPLQAAMELAAFDGNDNSFRYLAKLLTKTDLVDGLRKPGERVLVWDAKYDPSVWDRKNNEERVGARNNAADRVARTSTSGA